MPLLNVCSFAVIWEEVKKLTYNWILHAKDVMPLWAQANCRVKSCQDFADSRACYLLNLTFVKFMYIVNFVVEK